MKKEIVSLKNICRSFETQQVQALNDISLTIYQGEFLTIIGPSGSGKTTLLNIISGMDKPSKGEVFFNNDKIDSYAHWVKIRSKRIGFVFQQFNLLPTFTAIENVEVPMFGIIKDRERRRIT